MLAQWSKTVVLSKVLLLSRVKIVDLISFVGQGSCPCGNILASHLWLALWFFWKTSSTQSNMTHVQWSKTVVLAKVLLLSRGKVADLILFWGPGSCPCGSILAICLWLAYFCVTQKAPDPFCLIQTWLNLFMVCLTNILDLLFL